MTRTSTHRLILMRHAKSAYPDGVADAARPLTARGRRDATAAGRWLIRAQPPVDAVLCSPAERARQTAELVAPDSAVTIQPRLYGAGVGEITDVIGTVGLDVHTLLVVAHAPGLPAAAAALAGDGSAGQAIEALHQGFPTSAIAVLDVPGPWSMARPGVCRLVEVHVPRA